MFSLRLMNDEARTNVLTMNGQAITKILHKQLFLTIN